MSASTVIVDMVIQHLILKDPTKLRQGLQVVDMYDERQDDVIQRQTELFQQLTDREGKNTHYIHYFQSQFRHVRAALILFKGNICVLLCSVNRTMIFTVTSAEYFAAAVFSGIALSMNNEDNNRIGMSKRH